MPKIELGCGEQTCFNFKTYRWCIAMQTTRLGSLYMCGLFNKELIDQDGTLSGPNLLQRLPECLKLSTD